MSETEWDSCSDPEAMIRALPVAEFQKELRLFTTTCVRRIWFLVPPACRRAVESSEQFAQGRVNEQELAAAVSTADVEAQECWAGGRSPDALAYAVSAAVERLRFGRGR